MTATSSISSPTALGSRLTILARDIKLSHTLFAMPFALLSTFLAAGGVPHAGQLLLILICMVAARTLAMSVNRLLDAKLDALNPRTARRAIPAGLLSPGFYMGVIGVCAMVFIASTGMFWVGYGNRWPLVLSVPVLGFLAAYPLLKRFTRLCHYYLGAALALAPICAWIAIRGDLAWPPVVMAGAVLMWTAGFDIIYACQDYESDLATGTFSAPARLGIGPALWVARITHAGSAGLLVLLGHITPAFGPLYYAGAAAAIALLIIEHALVKPSDLSKVGLAFFTINGIISLLLGTLGIIDIFV